MVQPGALLAGFSLLFCCCFNFDCFQLFASTSMWASATGMIPMRRSWSALRTIWTATAARTWTWTRTNSVTSTIVRPWRMCASRTWPRTIPFVRSWWGFGTLAWWVRRWTGRRWVCARWWRRTWTRPRTWPWSTSSLLLSIRFLVIFWFFFVFVNAVFIIGTPEIILW